MASSNGLLFNIQKMNMVNKPIYDLESRTLEFTKQIKLLIKGLPRTLTNIEFSKQLIRSAGSIGANYIEANESLGKKDFIMHIRISCKEARETKYWLNLIDTHNEESRQKLIRECSELVMIFGSMLRNTRNN